MTWMPKKRNVRYESKPEGIPDYVYQEAMIAKKFYNEDWEFWVWNVSKDYNIPLPQAEDACIRGIQKAIHRVKYVYGDKIASWYERYLDMGDIFRKVNHPTYLNQLGEDTNVK